MNKNEIADQSQKFLDFYDEYYMSRHSDEDITDYTTQAYYYSMNTERKRLEQNGLRMSTKLFKEKRKINNLSGELEIAPQKKRDGNCHIGIDTRRICACREFYRDNKRIYREKHDEISRVCLLESNVDGNAECPNCGHVGKISSYINGCDYCGAKYEVKEFEPKVSAFSLNEDVERVTQKTLMTTKRLCYGLIIFLILSFVVGAAFNIYAQMNNEEYLTSGFFLTAGWYFTGPMIRFTVVISIIVFFIFRKFRNAYRSNISNEEIVTKKIKNFSVQDFFQNVEMKLNQIYLAQKEEDVKAYATCSLKELVESHLDVVDSHMISLEFLDVTPKNNTYIIKARAVMRLYQYRNNRIRRVSEKVHFEVEICKNISTRKMIALKIYKCGKCGNHIDVMKGGVCEYCGNTLSLEDIGFRFLKVSSEKTLYELAPKIIAVNMSVFALVFALNAAIPIQKAHGYNAYQVVNILSKIETTLNGYFDAAPLPEEVASNKEAVILKDNRRSQSFRELEYCINDGFVLEEYKNALAQAGYEVHSINDQTLEARKKYVYYSEDLIVLISVTVEENKMSIRMERE